jgi:hypothetical protein
VLANDYIIRSVVNNVVVASICEIINGRPAAVMQSRSTKVTTSDRVKGTVDAVSKLTI